MERGVGSALVVLVDELVEESLEFRQGGGGWLGGEPFLEGLLEAFDFAAGGGVVGAGVLLGDVERGEGGLESVAAAAVAGEADGVDESVVGEHGGREARVFGLFR